MQNKTLYLASASPRRSDLLSQIGVSFLRLKVQVDETLEPVESPSQYVDRLARAKARAGWEQAQVALGLPVLGADTCVVAGQQIMGKPDGRKQAVAMLQQLSGTRHQVYSAVALVHQERIESVVVCTQVSFRTLLKQECEAYWETGEPIDKAGAYAIQGYAGVFVSRIEGSYSSVVGLPLLETAALLKKFNVPTWDF